MSTKKSGSEIQEEIHKEIKFSDRLQIKMDGESPRRRRLRT